MSKKINIIALIPARSGSKGIINKNIQLYKGNPLFTYSIKIALESKYIKSVYVSTDSEEYQKIALNYGAKITPLRPKEISDDLSPDIDTFYHFLNTVDENVDLIVHLRPTYPNRSLYLLDNCIKKFLENYDLYDSLRTVVKINKLPYKMYHIINNNLTPIIKEYNGLCEPFNHARQNFPDTYLHNGCIDIVKASLIYEKGLLSGHQIYPYIMEDHEIDDIDTIEDFTNAENKLNV